MPVPEGFDDVSVYDPDVLDEVSGGDPAFRRDVIEDFIAACRPLLAALAEAVRTGDATAIQRHTHTLKGSGLALGAGAFGAACRELEVRQRAGDTAGVAELQAMLASEYARLEPVLLAWSRKTE